MTVRAESRKSGRSASLREATIELHRPSAPWKAAWLLIVLAAVMQVHDGLSSILLPFLGEASRGVGMTSWMVATGALQSVVAVVALMRAVQQSLMGATGAVAGCMLLGWLATVPPVVQQGLDMGRDAWLTSGYFVLSPFIAITAAGLAWRGRYPVMAAFIVTAPTCVGLLFVVVFAISIALYGF